MSGTQTADRNEALSGSPSRKAIGSLVLGIASVVILAVCFAVSGPLGVLISPLAFVGSLSAVILAIWGRREIANIYARGQQVFQPLEPDLLRDRSVTNWALVLGLLAIPVEVIFTLVLFLF